ncbi:hypothetical protein KOR34_21210 [Posidoniimonas corsicana]|uniref:Uncharacterized protein n=1 Tax=Posidoniimonas corsicana TaxID=1938618 RepID=A0A5C5VEW1_9BACT|nr:hypothetical protein KOR34_21210 [Posidoniimonas corsicana]
MATTKQFRIWLLAAATLSCSCATAHAASLECRLALEVTNVQGQTTRVAEIPGPRLPLQANKLSLDVVSLGDDELSGSRFPGVVTAAVAFNPSASRRRNPLDVALSYSADGDGSQNGPILASSVGRFSLGPDIALTSMLPTFRPGVTEIQMRCSVSRRNKAYPRKRPG